MDRLVALREKGVMISHDYEYVGRGEERQRVELDSVHYVKVPLSPDDWYQLATRDGEHYVGGCCAHTSAMQNIINYMFRDGGGAEGSYLLELGRLAEGHEGFEDFKGLDDEQFENYLKDWDKLGPWEKLAAVYVSLKDRLKERSSELPDTLEYLTKEERNYRVLLKGLNTLDWADFFNDEERNDQSQHQANKLVEKYRVLTPAQELVKRLEAELDKFEGFALVDKESQEVISNGRGLCIYDTEAACQEILEITKRSEHLRDGETSRIEQVEILPVRVSVSKGIEINP